MERMWRETRETKRKAGLRIWRGGRGISCHLDSWVEWPKVSKMLGGELPDQEGPGRQCQLEAEAGVWLGWVSQPWGPAQITVNPQGHNPSLPNPGCAVLEMRGKARWFGERKA